MSFVCPNCGYRDDPAWRNAYYDPHTCIMNWDDFQIIEPELSKAFLNGMKWWFRGPYVYEREPRKKEPIKYIKRGTWEEFLARNMTLHLVDGYTDSARTGKNRAILSMMKHP